MQANENNNINEAINKYIELKTFGLDGIYTFLQQRPPFLMIDKVIKLDVKENIIICEKCLSSNEWYFTGHFPQQPIMPGVLMVEAMAQTATIIGKSSFKDKNGVLLFAGIDDVKFTDIAIPGDTLIIEAKIVKIREPLIIGECVVKKKANNENENNKIIATGTIKAFKKNIF